MASLVEQIKKVPVPVLVGGGGLIIGIAYIAAKGRQDNAPAEVTDEGLVPATPVGDEYADNGAMYGTVPSGVAYVQGGAGGEDASSTVGAVGQTALDTVAGIANTAIATLARQQNPPPDADLAQVIQATKPTIVTVPMPQPPPPPRPATPAAATKAEVLPAGYHRGNSVSEAKYKKVFPGAIGWARIASGGKGRAHWIDYHIRWPKGKIQRWRYTPAAGTKWKKIYG